MTLITQNTLAMKQALQNGPIVCGVDDTHGDGGFMTWVGR